MSLAERVAQQFTKQAFEWDGKIVGTKFRLRWTRGQESSFQLEELPVKGKKKLRKATIYSPIRWDHYITENILHVAKISTTDDYDEVKKKVLDSYKYATQLVRKDVEKWQKPFPDYLNNIKWDEDLVFFLNVEPENFEPLEIEGKDFSLTVDWNSFLVYSPNSDFQQSDPYYTGYRESSPTAARKLYKVLKSFPKALKQVPYNKLSQWFDQSKVDYKSVNSPWR